MRSKTTNAELLFRLIVVGYVFFILSASFYSATWTADALKLGIEKSRLSLWVDGQITFRHLRDIATNILLYMPLGLLVAILVSFRGRIRLLHPAILIGLALSMVIETIQAFVGRFSDPTDIASNGLGHALGFMIMAIAINRFQLSPAHLLGLDAQEQGVSRAQSLQGLRFLYVAVFVIVAIVPLDFAVGFSDILRKLRPVAGSDPRLILDLGYHWKQLTFPIQSLSLITLAFAPVALLTALIDRLNGAISMSRPILHCVVLAFATEGAQLFLASGRSDILVPLLAAGCAVIVAYLTHAVGARYQRLTVVSTKNETSRYLILLMGLYLTFVFALAWSPYEFESPGTWKNKLLHETNLIPFRLHFSSRSVAAAIDIVREMAILLPLGALFAQWMGSVAGYLRWPVRALAGGTLGLAVGLAVEGSQSIVVGRYIDVTDALLAAGGCLVGCIAWAAVSPRLNSARALNAPKRPTLRS